MTTDMFAWAGGLALPHHINATGHEATSLLELPADATHARAPARESRSLQDKNGRRTLFINTIQVFMISYRRTFYDKPYHSTSVRLVSGAETFQQLCIHPMMVVISPNLNSTTPSIPNRRVKIVKFDKIKNSM